MTSHAALVMSGYLIKRSAIDWTQGGLDAASWIPGWAGSAASAGSAGLNLMRGNWGRAALDAGIAGLGLVGLNDVGKGLVKGLGWGAKPLERFGANWFGKAVEHATPLNRFGQMGQRVGEAVAPHIPTVTAMGGKAMDFMKSKPVLNAIPKAFDESAKIVKNPAMNWANPKRYDWGAMGGSTGKTLAVGMYHPKQLARDWMDSRHMAGIEGKEGINAVQNLTSFMGGGSPGMNIGDIGPRSFAGEQFSNAGTSYTGQ